MYERRQEMSTKILSWKKTKGKKITRCTERKLLLVNNYYMVFKRFILGTGFFSLSFLLINDLGLETKLVKPNNNTKLGIYRYIQLQIY